MAMTFFMSDHHVGYRAIIGSQMRSPRPFDSIEEHDETLVARWNAVVRPEDTVWHLGDFAYRCSEAYARSIFQRLNGRKLLIRGNHEKLGVRLAWAEPVRDVACIEVLDPEVGRQRLWLSHYAHRVWPSSFRGAIHLYGHSHGSLPGTATSLDVGVDCWDWTPVTLDRIRERLAANAAGAGS